MFISDPILKVFRDDKDYKESSIKTVDNNLKRLFWLAFAGEQGEYSSYMKSPEGVDPLARNLPADLQASKDKFYKEAKLNISYLSRRQDAIVAAIALLPVSQQSAYLNSVVDVYKRIPDLTRKPEVTERYDKLVNQLKAKRESEQVYKEPSEKDTANVVTEDELDQTLDKFNRLAGEKPQDKAIALKQLVVTLYTKIPPLRPQDYVNTKFVDKDPEASNYVDLAKKELVLTEGKTMKGRDARVIKLPDEVVTVMQRVKSLFDSEWLIPMVKDAAKPMSGSGFTHFLERVIGKSLGPDNVGASRLRNLYVSRLDDTDATADERKEAARVMGHSVGTQQTVYTKHSKKLHPKAEAEPSADVSDESAAETIKRLQAEIAKLTIANSNLEKRFNLINRRYNALKARTTDNQWAIRLVILVSIYNLKNKQH